MENSLKLKLQQRHKLTTEEFIERSKLKHGDKYDYSQTEYFGKFKKVKIICRVHGEFEMEAWGHMKGRGCLACSGFKPLTTEVFIEKANKIHNNKYDYSKTIFETTRKPVIIICPKHGEFTQKASGHLTSRGCSKCKSSKGETSIRIFLEQNNIHYIPEKTFDKCKNEIVLQFDFYIPLLNIIIEYDGAQHYKSVKNWGGEKALKLNQKRDKIKNDFCKKENIPLHRITYKENIQNRLKEIFT